jgi:hypothetical protein
LDQIGGFQPPHGAALKSDFGFGPQLVPIARQRIDINSAAGNRPEAPAPGLVSQVGAVVDSARL